MAGRLVPCFVCVLLPSWSHNAGQPACNTQVLHKQHMHAGGTGGRRAAGGWAAHVPAHRAAAG